MSLNPELARSARGLLGWSQGRVARATKLSGGTILDFEKGRRHPLLKNLKALQSAFEKAGIQFVDGCASLTIEAAIEAPGTPPVVSPGRRAPRLTQRDRVEHWVKLARSMSAAKI